MADREQTRWDAVTRLRSVVESVPDGFRDEDGVWRDGPLRQRARDALDALLAELQQAEQRVIDGAWDRSRLVEQLEQTERELDVANDALIETKHQLAKLPALVEALRELLAYHTEPDYPRSTDKLLAVEASATDALAAYKQEQDVPS